MQETNASKAPEADMICQGKLARAFLPRLQQLAEEFGDAEHIVPIFFAGLFSHPVVFTFSEYVDKFLEPREDISRMMRRRVYHVAVELLQNVFRHGYSAEKEGHPMGVFVFRDAGDHMRLLTLNLATQQAAHALRSRVERLNPLSDENLRTAYKMQLVGGALSDKGGAGLGLIDILKKAQQPIDFQTFPIPKTNLCMVQFRVYVPVFNESHSQ